MAGSMHAADAAGRLSALLSLLALRRLLAVLQPLALLLLLPFRWRARPGARAGAADAAASAPGASGKKGKASSSSSVVLRVPAGSPMVAARRQASARREIAMRRAREAGREYELIPTARGETLLTQCWWPHPPSTVKPRALVVVMHGLNEHSGRYDHLARRLNDIGIKVYGMDWTGHGGSDGLHGYVQSLDHAVDDLKMYLKKVSAENPGLPCFCFGHSTGGGIILKAALDSDVESLISGVVLTSPAVRVQPAHPIIAPVKLGVKKVKRLPFWTEGVLVSLKNEAGHGTDFCPRGTEVPVDGVPQERPAGVARPGSPAGQIHGPAGVHGRHPREDGLRDPPPDVVPAAAPAPGRGAAAGHARRRRPGDGPQGLEGAVRAGLVRGQVPQALPRAAARPPDRTREGQGDGRHRGVAEPQGLMPPACRPVPAVGMRAASIVC